MPESNLQATINEETILADYDRNLARIREIAGETSDLLVNSIEVSGVRLTLLGCEGMISTSTSTELILHPLMNIDLPDATGASLFDHIYGRMLLSLDRMRVTTYGDLFRTLNSGFALLITEGMPCALAMGVQGYDKRGIDEPSGEANVMGAHEGFTEVVRTNMSLIRRRMKSPVLCQKLLVIGEKSRTDVCMCYLRDRVPQSLLDNIEKALTGVNLETVLSTGYLRPFLEPRRRNLVNATGTTERPDVFCSKLLEGRVGVLIDGTPFAIVVPRLFVENFQTLDDYNFKPYYATFLRWLKYLAFLIALFLPAVYTAIAIHHPELLNSTLLNILADAEQNAPFSLMTETLGVLLMYEIIREAGLRLPKAVGGAVSIVAGLIIGDAAVDSGLISTPLLTIVALSVVTGFVVPELNQGITILRLCLVVGGGVFGLFGVSLIGMALLFNLCATEDYGYPITAPVSPFQGRSMRDVLTRVGFRRMQNGNFTVEQLHE